MKFIIFYPETNSIFEFILRLCRLVNENYLYVTFPFIKRWGGSHNAVCDKNQIGILKREISNWRFDNNFLYEGDKYVGSFNC